MEFRKLREWINEHPLAEPTTAGFIGGYACGVITDIAFGSYPLFSLSTASVGAVFSSFLFMEGALHKYEKPLQKAR